MGFPKLSFFEKKKTLLLCHVGADIDSLASAAAVYFSFKNKTNKQIGVPEHLNSEAKVFAERMSIPSTINPSLNEFDCIICFDFSTYDMAGKLSDPLKNFKGSLYIIDHHEKISSPLVKKCTESMLDAKAASTTELVYGLLEKSEISPGKNAAVAIACGIIVDSAGFVVATPHTFEVMAKTMKKSGKQFIQLVELFEVETDISEKVAKLKAARRSKIYNSHGCLVVTSEVGAFESSAASVLVRLGADVAFAGATNEKGLMLISGRCKNTFIDKTGFSLVKDVFSELGKYVEGEGGGHPAAAAFNGKGDAVAALKKCVELTNVAMGQKYGKQIPIKEYS